MAASRRAERRHGKRSRRVIGASVIALGGLSAGYLQAFRLAPAAYAAALPCGINVVDDTTLDTAIDDFNDGGCDTINVTGNFTLGATPSRIVFPSPSNELTITGGGTINGDDSYRPFDATIFADDTLTISDLTVTQASSRGAVFPDGGALAVNSHGGSFRLGTVILDDVTMSDSAGRKGAAATLLVDRARVTNSAFTDNVARTGGGALFIKAAEVQVTDSTFDGNSSSSSGGALYLYGVAAGSAATVTGSTFTDNRAGTIDRGGAIFNYYSDLTVTDSYIARNDSSTGGGITMYAGTLRLDHTTLQDNSSDFGGGIRIESGSTITGSYSSIIDNYARVQGGGIDSYGDVTLVSTYVGGNSSTMGVGGIYAHGVLNPQVTLEFATVFDDSTASPGPTKPTAIKTNGTLTTTGSVIGSSFDDTVWSAAYVDDTNSVTTDQGGRAFSGPGSQTVAAGEIGLDPRDGALPGTPGRSPSATSPLVTGASLTNPSPSITLDQLGVLRVSPFTIGARQFGLAPPPPIPTYPPSAPRDVTAVAGERSAIVSWKAPADPGSFPVSNYQVTASPGGASCLASAPSLSCTVSGLANGTTYSFTVKALNGVGWGPLGGPSNDVTPGRMTPAPPPQPLPMPLAPGASLLIVGGAQDPNLAVDPNASRKGLDISGQGFSMTLAGLGPDGRPLNLAPDGTLLLESERDVRTTGSGFLPNSQVDLYLDPPVQDAQPVQDTQPLKDARLTSVTGSTYVGTVTTDANGDFSGTATLPDGIAPGDHVLQSVGWTTAGEIRALSLGVTIEPSLVLDRGERVSAGVNDRIRTSGESAGIPAGALLTPHIRYGGESTFRDGKATITVQSDGSFRWSRLVRKDKALTAYVSYADSESNTIVWARIR